MLTSINVRQDSSMEILPGMPRGSTIHIRMAAEHRRNQNQGLYGNKDSEYGKHNPKE